MGALPRTVLDTTGERGHRPEPELSRIDTGTSAKAGCGLASNVLCDSLMESFSMLSWEYWRMDDATCSLSIIDGHPVVVLMEGRRLLGLQPCRNSTEASPTASRWLLDWPRRWPDECDLL